LGAGEILQMQHGPEDHLSPEAGNGKDYKIVGLTSAAALWVTAALGIVAGCGLWQLGLLAGGLTVVTLDLVKRWEKRTRQRSLKE
jgi:putative Mg2+ transporter-C (MgtC) family protein